MARRETESACKYTAHQLHAYAVTNGSRYISATASIRKTSKPFNNQLVVQKIYEEGEEELEESDSEDDLEDTEMTFLIDEALHIAYASTKEKQVVIVWRDLDGETGARFEFVCDSDTNEAIFEKFDRMARVSQYERKHQKSGANLTDKDLEVFDFEPDHASDGEDDSAYQSADEEPETSPEEIATQLPPSTPAKTSAQTPSTDSLSGTPRDVEPTTPIATKSQVPQNATEVDPSTPPKQVTPGASKIEDIQEIPGTIVHDAKVSLHLFDAATGVFVEQLSEADVSIYAQPNFEFWLEVDSSTKKFIGVPIDAEMNPVFNYEHLSFIFNLFADNSAFSWLLKFATFEDLEKFQESFMQSLWEHTNKQKWIKIKPDEREYLADSFREFDMKDADIDIPDDDEDFEMEDEEYSRGLQQSSAFEGHDKDEGYDDEITKMEGNGKNSQLAVGHKSDRAFVVRDNRLGVFKQNADNELEFQTTIDNVATTKGKSFVPNKIMLHTQDRAMVMQDPDNEHSLFRMDIEYGKVVDEWEISDTQKLKAFAPSSKFAQSTDEQTLLGASDNGLFRIDPRLQGNKLVESQLKSYATKVNFSALASTEKGYIAVASQKGEIRLYDRLGINAKTQLPAMGDPIIGVDVSSDGKWILATCKTYLLLIDATIKEGKNEGQIGFLKSFGKDSKPRPRRLQISPEHLAHMQVETGSPLNFTMAHFNAGLDSREQTIVTSSGPFVVTWSLKKLLRGDKSPYLIKRYGDNVAADNFKFGTDKNVIIALDNDVGMVDRRTFRKPTRETLATPARRIQALSRRSIVNSPY